MKKVIVNAPCKVNFFLQIEEALENGYHALQTVMQTISLHDIVTIEKNRFFDSHSTFSNIDLTSSDGSLPVDETNLAHRAVIAFEQATQQTCSVRIHLEKIIPMQAGLGGGSSNAAAVLVGLNALYDTKLSREELCAIGVELGADVPFCIQGGSVLAKGIGEIMTPINPIPPCYLVIAKPAVSFCTTEIFSAYDNKQVENKGNLDSFLAHWEKNSLKGIAEESYNMFTEVIDSPEITELQFLFEELGALGAVLSGSGSAVVGIFDRITTAEICRKALAPLMEQVFLVEPSTQGAHLIFSE